MGNQFLKSRGCKQLPITHYQLPITNYQLPITNYQMELIIMKFKQKWVLTVLIPLLYGIIPSTYANDNLETIVNSNNAFALDLYANLKNEKKGNLFFSPYSISTALAMAYAGARGNTAKQMAQVLHFTLTPKQLHPAFARLKNQLNTTQEKSNLTLNIANAIWLEQTYPFVQEFITLLKQHYQAEPNAVDFKTAYDTVRKTINTWVEQQTNNKIKNLIKPDTLDQLTRLVLVNAIYFKGDWDAPFEENYTKDDIFWVTPRKEVKTPMMTQTKEFNYLETQEAQLIELSYTNHDLSMIILLPKDKNGLTQLENSLSHKNLNTWLARLRSQEVKVYLPKFKTTSELNLGKTLSLMGMPDAFNNSSADFSGITPSKDIFISALLHKAFVEVNEEGTEAAAATGFIAKITSIGEPPPIFKADHPFIFIIRDNHSGSILFLGRMINPQK